MNATCLRCDWEGATDARGCPRCGAPLYRPAARDRARRVEEPSRPVPPVRDSPRPSEDRPLEPARPVGTSSRSVFVVVGAVFALIVFLLSQGDEPGARRIPPGPAGQEATRGLLVYAVEERGAARLYRWDIAADTVERGPLIRSPLAIVNVRSPGYGWLGLTTDLGNGVREASVLDSLEPDATPKPLGRGDVVTWARQGATVVLVDRGPLGEGCRREVSVEAVTVGVEGRDVVLDEILCGDVLTAGRTSIGYFLTRQDRGGVDVVGAGYADAGVLLADHGVIGISPAGDMLVTPSAEFFPALVPPRPARDGTDPPPLVVAGRAFVFAQFGGRPVPVEASGVALRVDEVLGYAPGGTTALVTGRRGGERPALWEIPLASPGSGATTPRYVAEVAGFTAAAYSNDGTAIVVTSGGVWRLDDHRLTPLALPEDAPVPTGPLVWIVREPFIDL